MKLHEIFENEYYIPDKVDEVIDWIKNPPIPNYDTEELRSINFTTNYAQKPLKILSIPSKVRVKLANNKENFNKFQKELDIYLKNNGLDLETRLFLEGMAGLESSYDLKAKSKYSSASGYFLFIDSTRQLYSKKSKLDFLNDPQEQIKVAVKHVKYLIKVLGKDNYEKALDKGLTTFQIMYGMWWRPKSMVKYIKTGKDDYKNDDGMTIEKILKYAS